MKPQIPWLRIFVEGVVIVGSILLALAADAWWDGRQAAQLEAEVLVAVAEEVAVNQAALEFHLTFTDEMLDRTRRFLGSPPSALASLPRDSMFLVTQAFSRPQTFDALTAAAAVLSQTPVLSSHGVQVRALVSQFLTEVEDAREEKEEFREASLEVRGRLAAYAARAFREPGRSADEPLAQLEPGAMSELLAQLGPGVLAELHADEEFVRRLLVRSTIQALYANNLQRVGDILDSLAAVLAPSAGVS